LNNIPSFWIVIQPNTFIPLLPDCLPESMSLNWLSGQNPGKVIPGLKAFIICALGSMDATKEGSVWPGIVQSSVKGLQALGDDKITTFFFDYNGHHGHPTVFHDFQMANELTEFIHDTVLKEQ